MVGCGEWARGDGEAVLIGSRARSEEHVRSLKIIHCLLDSNYTWSRPYMRRVGVIGSEFVVG
jgi:hypothetical protein